MTENVSLLPQSQIEEAGEVLSRAFYDDPLQMYLIPDALDRRRLSPPMFNALIRYGHLYGEVLTTAESISGAAIWMPPGTAHMTEEGMEKAGVSRLPSVIGDEIVQRFTAFFGYMEQFHDRDVAPEHWYLAVIGVDPPRQGQGVGRSLIKPVLARADAGGLPCYLETTQPRNVPFYQGLGFRVVLEDVEPVSSLRFWTFRRDPK